MDLRTRIRLFLEIGLMVAAILGIIAVNALIIIRFITLLGVMRGN